MSWINTIVIFVLIGVMTVAGNTISYPFPAGEAAIGYLIMLAITIIGMALGKVIPIKLPMVFWISVVALLSTSPLSPWAKTITYYTSKVEFLAICTPILAYAGLSVGKDLDQFKKMSWRIVVVALAVYTGTFLMSTAIAQVMLKFEGLI